MHAREREREREMDTVRKSQGDFFLSQASYSYVRISHHPSQIRPVLSPTGELLQARVNS